MTGMSSESFGPLPPSIQMRTMPEALSIKIPGVELLERVRLLK
jgi:hypothetical protein